MPPLVIDGIPTPVEKMTQAQLRAFIPLMLKYSTGKKDNNIFKKLLDNFSFYISQKSFSFEFISWPKKFPIIPIDSTSYLLIEKSLYSKKVSMCTNLGPEKNCLAQNPCKLIIWTLYNLKNRVSYDTNPCIETFWAHVKTMFIPRPNFILKNLILDNLTLLCIYVRIMSFRQGIEFRMFVLIFFQLTLKSNLKEVQFTQNYLFWVKALS